MLGQSAPQSTALGQLGAVFINDTNAHTGLSVGIIYCTSACTFTTLTSSVMTGTLTNITLAAGMAIYGQFSAITLGQGSVIAYTV